VMTRSDDTSKKLPFESDPPTRLTIKVFADSPTFDAPTRTAPTSDPQTDRAPTSDPPTALVPRGSFRELLPGSVIDETYEVDAKIGAGAMGEVYAARHIKLGKRVAIKVIGRRLSEDDAAIERFAMEARTLAQIQHPAIVAVEHVGELADGRAYFVMEFLRGETLFERLQRGRVPLPEALHVLDQIARGLDAAHGEGVTHRDLKPENVFLVHLPGEPPIIKLVDFGLSKLMAGHVDQRAERTQSGVAIGTPLYMSPEQMRGPDVDHRTDIYALGCVAYEMLLGVPPFPHAKTAPELYAAHLHEVPPLPRSIWPEIPPQLDLALFAMLAKDPAHRPTLAQVRAVVANAATMRPGRDAAPTIFVRPRPSRSMGGAIALAIAVAALVGGITIGAALTSRGPLREGWHGGPGAGASDAPPARSTTAAPPTPVAVDAKTTATAAIDAGLDVPPVQSIQPPRTSPRIDGGRAAIEVPTSPDAHTDAASVEPPDAPLPKPPDATPPPRPSKPSPRPIDKNQTVNPFAKHHTKVNP